MDLGFSGSNVVVTGGTGALGSAVVGALLDHGAVCHVSCLDESELKRFPFAKHNSVRVRTGVNLTDEHSVAQFYGALDTGRALWASIHLAGGFAMAPIGKTSKDDFVKQMQMNALTCFLCCREAVKSMRAGEGGRIVNVAARPALEARHGAGMVAYTAAKAAVAAITQALAEELAPEGILVNAVAPSIMDTPANRAAMPNADFSKWPKVEEVAATILFLASAANRVTRGTLAPVYGKS